MRLSVLLPMLPQFCAVVAVLAADSPIPPSNAATEYRHVCDPLGVPVAVMVGVAGVASVFALPAPITIMPSPFLKSSAFDSTRLFELADIAPVVVSAEACAPA